MIFFKIVKSIYSIPFNAALHASSKRSIGGQAVIEGVMMKGASVWSVAVRGGDGQVHIKREELRRLPDILKLPVLRGVVALYQALSLGIKAIDFSASKAYEEEEGAVSPVAIITTIMVAFALGVAMFVLLPLYLTKLAGIVIPIVKESSAAFNIVDGLIRVGVFLLYVVGIGLWSEMRRIYEYHGAEHKVIHAYEDGQELTANAEIQKYSPLHPRCGTSFLLIVMIVSILIFSLIPQDWNFVMKFLSRLVLIPLVAGLSYELLKLSARKSGNALVDILVKPGLMLQRLTTREPDESQIEIALGALREVIEEKNV